MKKETKLPVKPIAGTVGLLTTLAIAGGGITGCNAINKKSETEMANYKEATINRMVDADRMYFDSVVNLAKRDGVIKEDADIEALWLAHKGQRLPRYVVNAHMEAVNNADFAHLGHALGVYGASVAVAFGFAAAYATGKKLTRRNREIDDKILKMREELNSND